MKKKKISKKANLIICAVAFIIMIVYLVFVDSIDNVVAALSKINKGALIICVVFMIGIGSVKLHNSCYAEIDATLK